MVAGSGLLQDPTAEEETPLGNLRGPGGGWWGWQLRSMLAVALAGAQIEEKGLPAASSL